VDSLAPSAVSHPASDPAPRILGHLVAAGLASHELIGDPARLESETAALAALCARISGPVYRLGAFHYAFRMMPEDLDGRLAELEPADWTAALEAALAETLGAEAVWVSGTDPAAEAEAALDAAELTFLQVAGDTVAAALVEAPGLRAVIHADIAARSAETAAALAAEAIAARLAGLEADAQARLDAAIATAAETAAAAVAAASRNTLERLAESLAALADRLQDQSARLAEQSARQDALASGIAALEASIAGLVGADDGRAAALRGVSSERLGLALAEFLAQTAPGMTPAAPGREAPATVPGRVLENVVAPVARAPSAAPLAAPVAAPIAAPIARRRAQAAAARIVETGREPGAVLRGVAALQLG
jgi:hypothetical protein